jgi:hypothetical protein
VVQMDYDCNVRQRALYVEPFTYFCAFFFQGLKVVNIKVGYRKFYFILNAALGLHSNARELLCISIVEVFPYLICIKKCYTFTSSHFLDYHEICVSPSIYVSS